MATYKVLQDIEAEDKFVGPLTLKQFIFAAITVVCGYFSFILLTKNLWYIALIFLPVMIVSGFLAFPWGRDQPTETWLLAKIQFFFKPHLRIWDQSGVQELVTITAPKHIEAEYTSDNLSQTEVKSRLKALADTIDSRGWVVKNVNVNLASQPMIMTNSGSDRLIDINTVPQEVSGLDLQASDDMMDANNNPTAQHLNQMIVDSTQSHRQATLQNLDQIRQGKPQNTPNINPWFMDQAPPAAVPAGYTTFNPQLVSTPGTTSDLNTPGVTQITEADRQLLEHIHHDEQTTSASAYSHMRTLQPLDKSLQSKTPATPKQQVTQTMTPAPDPVILGLADNNDLTVATIARQANKQRQVEQTDNEVIVSLH